MFFNGWDSVGRTLIVGFLAYIAVVALVRISGKRTLAKMNAFDLVVTIALGSTLASILLSKDVSLVQGLAALALLIGLQYVVAWSSVRSGAIRRITRSEPRLIVHHGQLLTEALCEERLTEEEVLAAIRSRGIGGLQNVKQVILETDGSLSVIGASADDG